MRRRRFSREFKVEAVKLVRERGVSAAQAARDLDVHENVLRKWVKEFGSDPVQAFPGHGQMKPEQLEIERLKREVNKLKAETDANGYFRVRVDNLMHDLQRAAEQIKVAPMMEGPWCRFRREARARERHRHCGGG